MSAGLHVEDAGTGSAVVLLHAFPCSSRMWAPQAAALVTAGHRVLSIDLPGFGRSPLPATAPSLDVVADAVLATLDARDVRHCALAGISLGGYVSMAMVARQPEIVDALILCDTKATADGETARENRERLAVAVEQAPGDAARILEQAVLPGLLGDTTRGQRPAVVDQVRDWLQEASASSVAWYQRAMAQRPDSTDVLAALDAPGLVVWGDEDALSPMAEQEVMLDALADGWLAVIEGAGHLSNVERPDAVSGVVVDFLSRWP